jgi:hypothetical protein
MSVVLTRPVGRDTCDASARPAPLGPAAVYTLACCLGGATTGFVLAQLAATIRHASAIGRVSLLPVAGAVALTAVACEWRGTVHPLPERRAQVPRRWVRWRRPTATAAAFGLMIGCGALTHLKHAAAYGLAAMILVAPSVGAGVLVGAVYGLSRGMTLMVVWIRDRFVPRRPLRARSDRAAWALNKALAMTALVSCAVAIAGAIR